MVAGISDSAERWAGSLWTNAIVSKDTAPVKIAPT
jgi:hypothetical protein